MNYLQISAIGSLLIQVLTGLFEAHGLFFNLKPEDKIVQEVLLLELVVQIIEFLFYAYLVYLIITKSVITNITSHRYIDWAITTPAMLISFVIFFKYLKNSEKVKITLIESFQEEKYTIIKILIANALMLLLGFLAEQNIINKYIGITLGFLPFAYVFKLIYANYVKDNNSIISKIIYYLSFLIWGLYGVGAVLPFTTKNTMYNILDLFAKNAYGLFLFFYLRSKKI